MSDFPVLLEIQTGKHRGRRLRLQGTEILIGRGEEAVIRIASTEVSREHCRLIPQADGLRVIDLNSRNGTFVDGRPITGERLLQPGGMLTVGPMTFLLIGNEDLSVRHSVKVALKGKKGSSDQISEDKIVNWLSDYEMPVTAANASRDTSIIRKTPASVTPPPAVAVPVAPPLPAPAPTAPLAKIRSVRDEAREIIRLYFESLGPDAGNS